MHDGCRRRSDMNLAIPMRRLVRFWRRGASSIVCSEELFQCQRIIGIAANWHLMRLHSGIHQHHHQAHDLFVIETPRHASFNASPLRQLFRCRIA